VLNRPCGDETELEDHVGVERVTLETRIAEYPEQWELEILLPLVRELLAEVSGRNGQED
jgi:hypothetical protein